MAKIELYTSDHCPYCVKAKALLDQKGQTYEEIRVDLNDADRETMLSRSNGARTVPQIFINDHHVGGCDDLYALHDKGELDSLLNQSI